MAKTQAVAAEKTEVSQSNLNVAANADSIWRVHAALDRVYGGGFSKERPEIVAQFMQAFAMQTNAEATHNLAAELATLREILASGEGGLTVGLEK